MALSAAREETDGARASELTDSDGREEGAGGEASGELRARAGAKETRRVGRAAEGESSRLRFEPAVGVVEVEGASWRA